MAPLRMLSAVRQVTAPRTALAGQRPASLTVYRGLIGRVERARAARRALGTRR